MSVNRYLFAFIILIIGSGVSCQNSSKIIEEEPTITPSISVIELTIPATISTNITAQTSKSIAYELASPTCENNNCLFYRSGEIDYPFGIANISGYFLPVERIHLSTEICDGFTIIGGSFELLRAWKNLIEDGNGVNSLNESGQLLINLDLSTLTQAEQNKIKESSEDNPLKLVVFSIPPIQMGAPTCYSKINILRIE